MEGTFIHDAGGISKLITYFIQNMIEFKEDEGVFFYEDMKTSVRVFYSIGKAWRISHKKVVITASYIFIAVMSIGFMHVIYNMGIWLKHTIINTPSLWEHYVSNIDLR